MNATPFNPRRPGARPRPIRSAWREPVLAAIVGAALVTLVAPTLALADDTDIYSPPQDADFKPTLMFMVDTSGSMRLKDEGPHADSRRDRLLDPLIDFVRSAKDVRAGLSTFNGSNRGGAIVQAADDLDRDLCPDASCGSISLRTPILRNTDDSWERVEDGKTGRFAHISHVGRINDYLQKQVHEVATANDAVVETFTGGVNGTSSSVMPAETMTLFRNEAGEVTNVGLHFPDVDVPDNALISRVFFYIDWAGNEYLDPAAGEGSGTATTRITFDSRAVSPPLADAAGQRVSDRPESTEFVDWDLRRPDNWESTASDYVPRYTSPDLSAIFREVRQPDTEGTITILMKPAPGLSIDKTNTVALLGFNSRQHNIPPRMVVEYYDADAPTTSYLSGLRFDQLDVPRGALITGAHLEVSAGTVANQQPIGFQVRAEASGDARTFEFANHDVSSRALLGDVVNWDSDETWRYDQRYKSPDLATLVQQVTSRDDWCAGNALALQISGDGYRRIFNHDRRPMEAPSLHVTYDAASVDAATTCRAQPPKDALLLASEGDVVQKPGGEPQFGRAVFETDLFQQRLGLRFSQVNLDADDKIADARLTLSPVGMVAERIALMVGIDSDTASVPFDGATSLPQRVAGEPSIGWMTDELTSGARVRSVNLAPLIRRALADPGWRRGNDLVLTVRRSSNLAISFATSHSNEARGPTLRITRQLDGQDALDLPLRTPRDELVERLQTLPAAGETPLLDAFLETAQYLNGQEVVHGRRRGEQMPDNAVHRLSVGDAWTDGHVYRPLGCDADDPGNVACVDETIEGSPVYTAPPVSECRANQLVLVTDGDPTPSTTDSGARIRGLTGTPDCNSASGDGECAIDLARWLAAGGEDRAPVRVNTIGFAFDSTLLDQVAEAGSGRSVSVSSASELDEALLEIADIAEFESATLTGPAVSVSQFNRSTHRDDAYVGLFHPDEPGKPWAGNLKRYSLGALPDGGVGLIDALGRAAVDPDTGRFAPGARSWWSPTADGATVSAGGAASRLPIERRVLTWPAASAGEAHGERELVDFEPANEAILASELGVDEATRTEAIRWMRGEDVRDADGDGITNEPRLQMGAAIHTTPTVLDYATSQPEGRSVVFAGTQEGFLHGIDTATGRELFAYLPHELYGNVGALFDPSPGPMRYGLDGQVTSWMSDENGNGLVDSGESAYITVGMRRSGSHYYTLDVSDPDEPSIAWTIDPTREGFGALKQSWTGMRQARLRVDPDTRTDGASTSPALTFTSGYDPINDDRTPGSDRELRRTTGDTAVYLVDPYTGSLLHGITYEDQGHSLPSDVAVVDLQLDGITDMLLVGSVSGTLLRVDLVQTYDDDGAFSGTAPAMTVAWQLSDSQVENGDAGDRRFFHPPDVALLGDGSAPPVLGVAIGSGRRDHPLETSTQDRLYMLRLDPTVPQTSRKRREHDLYDATDTPAAPPAGKRGWFIDLERAGEKILGSPVIADGRILVASYVPQSGNGDPCEPRLGNGRLYSLDAFTGAGLLAGGTPNMPENERSQELVTPGIPPPVSIVFTPAQPNRPAVFAGTEQIDALGSIQYRRQTYWITD